MSSCNQVPLGQFIPYKRPRFGSNCKQSVCIIQAMEYVQKGLTKTTRGVFMSKTHKCQYPCSEKCSFHLPFMFHIVIYIVRFMTQTTQAVCSCQFLFFTNHGSSIMYALALNYPACILVTGSLVLFLTHNCSWAAKAHHVPSVYKEKILSSMCCSIGWIIPYKVLPWAVT